ncbi:MAG: LysM peptidoglycan-binding domain-containing protein [Treponema sp.]|jgi:murein DD-endopeptidase MepM/ murein hydrolase activator NlpD|nr:LysM peptidoglycan-binding domain-containing protein [Treponema sp.]
MNNWFSVAGSGVLKILKKLFSRLWDIARYNPLFRKLAFASCIAAVVTGAVFLVLFAVASPELPPGNLFSVINDVSGIWESDNSMSHVVLSSSGDDWASLTLFDGTELETGAGPQTQNRSRDIEYPVRPGETLSEIAYAYDIPYDFLAWYNKITNANRIRVGTVIIIPSLNNIEINKQEFQRYKSRQRQNAAPARAVKAAKSIQIAYQSLDNGTGSGVTVHFSIVNPPSNLRSYEWDLGDGKRSFRESPSNEYSQPRTYPVRLTAQDNAGNIYKSNPLYIDIPYPASMPEHSTTRFVTLSSPDEYFVVSGVIAKVAHYNINDVLDLSESDQFLTKARFKKSGYFGVTVHELNGREQYYSVFVSPVPTMHVDLAVSDFNWYRTQFNSGTPSNCGPASASMGISWGTGKYYPVSAVREAIGWQGNGGTGFEDLLKVINNQGVSASLQPLKTTDDLKNVIDSGAIAIVLFLTDGVKTSRHDPKFDLFGKYYNDSVGHYVVVKGYSMNGEYLVIHDPIPSDWSSNSFRYADEISMMGRNRYFNTNELLRSLRRNEMIVVPGNF